MSDETAFIARYHELVDDLDRNGRRDGELMWLLGGLVARFVTRSGADNWSHLKRIVDPDTLRDLVGTLETHAATYDGDGKPKAAYVARLLGISLVAGRLSDGRLRDRDDKLDAFIDTAAVVFAENRSAGAGAEP